MASLPAEDAERLNGKLAYLQDWYGKQSVDDIIGFYVPYNIPNEQGDVEVGESSKGCTMSNRKGSCQHTARIYL